MDENKTEQLAAEFVLGTLDVSDRDEAVARLATDAEFAALVSKWEQWLMPLSEASTPQVTSPSVWKNIEAEIITPRSDAVQSNDAFSHVRSQIIKLRQSLRAYQIAMYGALATAAVIALIAFKIVDLPWQNRTLDEQYVAMLMDDAGGYGFIVTVDPSRKKMMIRNLDQKPPSEKCHELWVIRPDGTVPSTLGIIKHDSPSALDLSGKLTKTDIEQGLKLAISVEPIGGAPSGLAMGPVVFSGELLKQLP